MSTPGTSSVTITIPHPTACDPNKRLHWRAKAGPKKVERISAEMEWRAANRVRLAWPSVTVRIEWRCKDRRGLRDLDNIIACCKPVLDAAQDAEIIANDKGIDSLIVARKVTGRDEVWIEITEIKP